MLDAMMMLHSCYIFSMDAWVHRIVDRALVAWESPIFTLPRSNANCLDLTADMLGDDRFSLPEKMNECITQEAMQLIEGELSVTSE